LSKTTIELENIKFSAGHFMIFSKTERDNLHGHDFKVSLSLVTEISKNGIPFDYEIFKRKITSICNELNKTFILPTSSPFLSIEITEDSYYAIFNGQVIPFLKRDVTLLPITNTSLEEFSRYILEKMISDKKELDDYKISEITVKVFSCTKQSASSHWEKQKHLEAIKDLFSTIKDS